jgi:nuclear transport factor 2 (NTF2) superfamily protein
MDLERWIGEYSRAWREKDPAVVAALFTDDASYRSSPTGVAHVGREAIMAYWCRATATQADLDLRFGVPVAAGDRVAVEWWAVMRDPGWRPDAASEWVTLPGCLILRFATDGRCSELREYYNPVLGEAIPAPSSWGG